MVIDIGGKGIDLEKVQVHPTGLVDPKEPDAKVKFLAAEALRGVGGLLLDGEGNRFCDELGHRDVSKFLLVLPLRFLITSRPLFSTSLGELCLTLCISSGQY